MSKNRRNYPSINLASLILCQLHDGTIYSLFDCHLLRLSPEEAGAAVVLGTLLVVGRIILTGVFETLSILFIVTALSIGSVVVMAPIAATYPVWAILGMVLFRRGLEQINLLTILGTLSVVTGTISIHLGH